jgi:hypothetical protein
LSISRVEQSLRIRQLQFQKSGADLLVSGYL